MANTKTPRTKCNANNYRFSAARKELAQWLSEGKIQRKETILKGGLQAAEQGLIDLYKGINTGRPVISSRFLRMPTDLNLTMLTNWLGKLLVEIKAEETSSSSSTLSRL